MPTDQGLPDSPEKIIAALHSRIPGPLMIEITRLLKPNQAAQILEMGMTESQHGARFIAWRDDQVRVLAAYVGGLEDLHHIPNGGKRDKGQARKLQLEGVMPGVPDYFLPLPMNGYAGLYLELKTFSGRPSAEQSAFLARAEGRGYAVCLCKGWRQAAIATIYYLYGAGPFPGR